MTKRRRNSRRIPVGHYSVVLTPERGGGYTVTAPALPGCVTFGRDVASAKRNAREAIECHIGSILEHGERVPVDETISTSVTVGRF